MSTVRVTCLLCDHHVEVAIADVVLHLEGSGPDAVNRYGFTCPMCSVYIVRQANAAVVAALLSTDVEVSTGALPPWESSERPEIVLMDAGPAVHPTQRATRPVAPPITEADVLLFRKALEDDSIMAAWLTG